MATFPNAQHVQCFLHFKGNIEQKLRELNVPSSVAAEIVKDIMGNPSQLQRGLVDVESTEKLEECLISFSKRWNEFEKPYNSPPFFHAWFLKHCQEVVAKFMLPSIRTKAGLGFPPTPCYTNEVESKNKILKDEVEHRHTELPDFVDKMRALLQEQRLEIERAIIGTGEYRIKSEYSNLAVEHSRCPLISVNERYPDS